MDVQFRLVKIDCPNTYWANSDAEKLAESIQAAINSYGYYKNYISKVLLRANVNSGEVEIKLPCANLKADLELALQKIDN